MKLSLSRPALLLSIILCLLLFTVTVSGHGDHGGHTNTPENTPSANTGEPSNGTTGTSEDDSCEEETEQGPGNDSEDCSEEESNEPKDTDTEDCDETDQTSNSQNPPAQQVPTSQPTPPQPTPPQVPPIQAESSNPTPPEPVPDSALNQVPLPQVAPLPNLPKVTPQILANPGIQNQQIPLPGATDQNAPLLPISPVQNLMHNPSSSADSSLAQLPPQNSPNPSTSTEEIPPPGPNDVPYIEESVIKPPDDSKKEVSKQQSPPQPQQPSLPSSGDSGKQATQNPTFNTGKSEEGEETTGKAESGKETNGKQSAGFDIEGGNSTISEGDSNSKQESKSSGPGSLPVDEPEKSNNTSPIAGVQSPPSDDASTYNTGNTGSDLKRPTHALVLLCSFTYILFNTYFV